MAIDTDRLQEMTGKVLADIGATFHAPLVLIGEKLGLFKELAEEKLNAGQLAVRTNTAVRYVEEWLPAMASGGYVSYDSEAQCYYLTPEQSMVLADEESPAYMPGAFQAAIAAIKSESKITDAFRTGKGSAGMSMILNSFLARSDFTSRCIKRIWSVPGFRRWTVCCRSSQRGHSWRMWVVDTDCPAS